MRATKSTPEDRSPATGETPGLFESGVPEKHGQEMIPLQGRTVSQSAVTMAEVMLPGQANPAGRIHGGEIMKLMDTAAGVVATRHARSVTATARVEHIDFLRPIYVGNLVTVSAHLTFVSEHTMEVGIDVTSEDLATGDQVQALTAYFIMVALDRQGHAKGVPPLILQTEEERRRFEAGRLRYQERKKSFNR